MTLVLWGEKTLMWLCMSAYQTKQTFVFECLKVSVDWTFQGCSFFYKHLFKAEVQFLRIFRPKSNFNIQLGI